MILGKSEPKQSRARVLKLIFSIPVDSWYKNNELIFEEKAAGSGDVEAFDVSAERVGKHRGFER